MTRQTKPMPDAPIAMQSPLRLLLAEDHPVNQMVAQTMLVKLGYRVTVVGNGREAVEAVKSAAYDLVLMDVQMPVMDGLQAAAEIRRLDIVQPKIVAVSANASDSDREACVKAGMDGFIAKPIQAAVLRAILDFAGGGNSNEESTFSPKVIQALQERVGGNGDAMRQLFDAYFAEARKSLEQMAEHLGAGNEAGLKREAHRLKGSSQMLGVVKVGYLCASLEANASLNAEVIRATLVEITKAVQEAKSSARGLLSGAS